MSPLIDVPTDEAAIIVELIDHYNQLSVELPKLYGHMADAFAAIGMALDVEPREPSFTARRGLEELRKKYAGIAHDERARAIAEQHHMRDILREVREPRTLEELETRDPFATPGHELERYLLALEELGHVRQLEDGNGIVSWEITEAGEHTL